jgi:hypothetical protein
MNVYQNGVIKSRFGVKVGDQATQYIIAENLPEGETLIEVTKTTEAAYGLIAFLGIHLPAGATLLPTPAPKRVIEFIGDSDSSGMASLGPKTLRALDVLPNFLYWSDPDFAAPGYIGRSFGVDVHNLGVGGSGFLTGDDYGPQIKVFPFAEHYTDRIAFNWGVPASSQKELAYSEQTVPAVDLVVIWLGQNDIIGGTIKAGEVAKGAVEYQRALEAIRRVRPDTPILCLHPASTIHTTHPESGALHSDKKRNAVQMEIGQWAQAAATAVGGEETKVYVRGVIMEPAFNPETDYGGFMEVGVGGQKKWARGVIPHVAEVTGWEVVSQIQGD